MRETTALGAAIAAGLAVGMWRNFAELRDINRGGGAVFEPKITPQESAQMFATWDKAVQMCRGWVGGTQHQLADKPISATDNTTTNGLNATTQPLNIPSLKKQQQQQPIVTETLVQQLTPPNDDDGVDYLGGAKVAPYQPQRQSRHHHHHSRFGSLDADLADADEEDLMIELRKLEILQQLKRMKKKVRATGGTTALATAYA